VLVETFGFTSSSVFIALSFVQECTEFANPVRERVTNIDGKIHTWWLHSNLVATKCGKATACTCKPAFVVFSDTDEEPIVVSILSSNYLRPIAPDCELIIHLYHSSGLIQWKTGLSACLHLFTLLSLEATHYLYFIFHFPS